MSRIELGGVGEPIPPEALPDPTTGGTPPVRVLFESSGNFDKTDYVSLGYTHWEAWAIGGGGGRGARVSEFVTWTKVVTRPVMSDADWELYLELMVLYASQLTPPYGPYGGTEAGARAYFTAQTPAHNPFYVYTHSNPVLLPVENLHGGAGGGGGLHYTGGLLSELGDVTAVVVGAAGADAPVGQRKVNGVWTPLPLELTPTSQGGQYWVPADTRLKELNNYFAEYMNKYPLPHTSFASPVSGSDGGASSFGATLARASGGKGGKPAQRWSSGTLIFDEAGGQGGKGDQVVAGGGAAGSSTVSNGSDGIWDGIIGEGGGGGRGGRNIPPASSVPASSGGQGSYSFGDPTVYGNRGVKDGFVPGGGGGAKVGSYKFGGYATSWSPRGAVILRLTAPV